MEHNNKTKIDEVTLNDIEKLKFQNLQLQRQIVEMQEGDLVKDIVIRTGVNISGWNMDLNTGICTPREK
jgi:hypothetical protein